MRRGIAIKAHYFFARIASNVRNTMKTQLAHMIENCRKGAFKTTSTHDKVTASVQGKISALFTIVQSTTRTRKSCNGGCHMGTSTKCEWKIVANRHWKEERRKFDRFELKPAKMIRSFPLSRLSWPYIEFWM